MKRLIVAILAVLLALAGCAQSAVELENTPKDTPERTAEATPTALGNEGESAELDGDTASQTQEDLIEIYSDEYVTVWYKGCKDSNNLARESEIVFVMQNKTDKVIEANLLFGALAVDGVNITDGLMFQKIAQFGTSEASVFTDQLKDYEPKQISGSFDIFDITESSLGERMCKVLFNISIE